MNTSAEERYSKDDRALEALFRHASARKRPPAEVERETREALHGEWSRMVRKRRFTRRVTGWAVAASVVLAIFISANLFWQPGPGPLGEVIAGIERRSGSVFVRGTGGAVSRLTDSGQLLAGNEIHSERDSRVALAWASGESVRMDQDSRAVLVSMEEIKLLSGRIYIDAADANTDVGALVIRTPFGPVHHIGTQYMTAVSGNDVTVSVRKGKVSIGSGEGGTTAVKGQEVHIAGNGQHSIKDIPTYGESWQWAELVAPGFNMDGRSMREFLDWVGRETGRRIEFASAEAEDMATEILLHGNVDVGPLRSLELLLQTSDLKAVVNEGVILVSL